MTTMARQLPQLPESSQPTYQQRVNGSYLTQSPARRRREDSGPPFKDYLTSSDNHSAHHNLPLPMYTPQRSENGLPAFSPTGSMDAFGSSGKKGFWRKLSTPPSASNSPSPESRPMTKRSMSSAPGTPTPYNDVSSSHLDGLPASPGLGRKRSTGQLLAEFGRGLSRVGSVIKRSTSRDDLLAPSPLRETPTKEGSKLGLSKQGSIRRQVNQGSWRGRKLAEGPDGLPAVGEESTGMRDMEWQAFQTGDVVVDVGDEGITRPFNVAHDLHISPDLDNLPAEWVVQLKAQGMTEAELLTISAARRRQATAVTKTLQIRHNSSRRRRTSSKRKESAGDRANRAEASHSGSSTPSVPNPSDPASPIPKSRLPALTHLDDRRPSAESSHLLSSSAGHSRAPSLTPSFASKAPPSSFSQPARSASSKRLSDQLRGFANINLDGVGSWADDTIGLVEEAGEGKPRIEAESGVRTAQHTRTGSVDSVGAERISSRSSTSPRSPKRVPIPGVSGPRKSTESASSQSHTSASGSTARRPTYSPSSSDMTDYGNRDTGEVPPPCVSTPKTPMPHSQPTLTDLAPRHHFTPLNSLTMSHTPSQSLSTTEDQEIRTPSTSEYGDVKLHHLTNPHAGMNQRSCSTESMGWIAPEESAREKVGKLGERLDLFDARANLSPLTPVTPRFERPVSPLTPRQVDNPTTAHSFTPRTNDRNTPSHLPPISDEEEYDLSIPSPLRPPPHPHFSLPASAAGDSDDAYDPLGLPEPGTSPLLRPSEYRLMDAMRYDPSGLDSKRESNASSSSRKESDGSILIIHQYSHSESRAGSRKGSGVSSLSQERSMPGSRKSGEVFESGSRKGSEGSWQRRESSLAGVMEKEGETGPKSMDKDQIYESADGAEEDVGDHLSPLRSSIHVSSLSSTASDLTNTSLPYLNSTRSTTDQANMPIDRQSNTFSTISGEESDTFRNSVAGAKIMTAQKAGQEVGRMSVFRLSAYDQEEPEPGART